MNTFEGVKKVFQLKLSSALLGPSPLWQVFGFQSEAIGDEEACLAQLVGAVAGEYDTILFPASLAKNRIWNDLKAALKKYEFKVLLAVEGSLSVDDDLLKVMKDFNRWALIRILDCTGRDKISFSANPDDFIWILGGKNIVNHAQVISENYNRDKTFFYFPYAATNEFLFPDIVGLHELTMLLQDKVEKIAPLPGVNVFDTRAEAERETDPYYGCETLKTALAGEQIIISVIIPTYNNKVYLSNVIRHLCYQDFEPEHFEVIIVDDGSTDDTRSYILESLPKDLPINLRYIYFPRSIDRKMGDGQFRAGIARNLGVRHAKGEILAFLDSDVLVPANYLYTVCMEHRHVDVTQARRVELKKELSSGQTSYQEVQAKRDTYINDPAFWHDFLYSGKPWDVWPDGWKYTCTHSLTVKTDVFKGVGWFRTAFLFYGYEDTDLGHRLWKAEHAFRLLDVLVYHLHHADTRSEYDNSQLKKMALLAKSAEIFYQNTLEHDVYNHCKYHFVKPFVERVAGTKMSRLVYRMKGRIGFYTYRSSFFIWVEQSWHKVFGRILRQKDSLIFISSKIFWNSVGLFSKPFKKITKGLRRE